MKLLREWQEFRRFRSLDADFRDLVFYSEGSGDWPHLGPVIEYLLKHHGQRLSYLTSDPGDPGLRVQSPLIRQFQVGSGSVRTILFKSLECRHFVMTLCDLDTFHLKRSIHPVHYVYLFHAINSTHTVYRKGAFDAYDTVLCVGPHHVDEIRRTERAYGLKEKELIEHGSVKLDRVIEECSRTPRPSRAGEPRTVLVAPSWGECSLIEGPVGIALIDTLLLAGHRTVLRLHPMTVRRMRKLVPSLRDRYRSNPLFSVEDDMSAVASWLNADVMVSDWSGAAIEFAFAVERPVVYINTPQKINNPEWERIGAPSFEDMIRFEIGHVVEQTQIDTVPLLIDMACRDVDGLRKKIASVRTRSIFNVGKSQQVAATYLSSLVRR